MGNFRASTPAKILFEKIGFTVENAVFLNEIKRITIENVQKYK